MSERGPTRSSVVSQFIRRYREAILTEWMQRDRETPAGQSLSAQLLRDHTPQLLDDIAAWTDDRRAADLPNARQHAIERLGEGFDITALVDELSLLRASMLAIWQREQVGGSLEDIAVLDRAIDHAIAASVGHFVEALRSERERALAKLESLLAASPVGIAFVDRDFRYLRINDALATLNGRPAAEHIGHTVGEMLPELATHLEPMLQRVLDDGISLLNLELTRPGATPADARYLLANYFPVRGPSGVITGVGGVVLDVTDTKRAEEELRIAVRTREDIMAVVSHDLRTPVATVQLSATLLMSQLGTDHRAKRHLDMIHRACTRMESLIDDLLDTASIREGRLDIDAKRELIEEVVTEAVDLQVPLAEEKNIAVVRDYRLETIHVRCDRERIIQVFANIIGNALKFCRAGDTITVSGERVADEVRFAIANTGPAIDPDRLTRIFEAYWSAPEHRARGSGLGLYIVRGIIEHHGGRIWAESRPGSGATFVFSIPVDR